MRSPAVIIRFPLIFLGAARAAFNNGRIDFSRSIPPSFALITFSNLRPRGWVKGTALTGHCVGGFLSYYQELP
jgi:hypothetical protein